MIKPIGNLSVNLKSNDKVSFQTRDRFAPPMTPAPGGVPGPGPGGGAQAGKPTGSVKKVIKYKKRKR